MPKVFKLIIIFIVPLVAGVGAFIGLAHTTILPRHKWAAEKGPLGRIMRLTGVKPLPKPVHKVTAAKAPAAGAAPVMGASAVADPLAAEKQALAAERQAFDTERANWQAQQQQQAKQAAAASSAATTAPPDPQQIAKLADVYSNMDSATIDKIISQLPEPEVVALLRQMDGRKVAHVLAGMKTSTAARLTMLLAQPPPALPDPNASSSSP